MSEGGPCAPGDAGSGFTMMLMVGDPKKDEADGARVHHSEWLTI